MPVSIDDIAKQMLALLPDDGTPVFNRVMRVMLSRALATRVDQDQYFEARDLLLKDGRIGSAARTRRAGLPVAGSRCATAARTCRTHRDLDRSGSDAALKTFSTVRSKRTRSAARRRLRRADTSAMGPRRGRWARPDFILVSAMKFNLMPGAQVDVHSFELKTESGATDLAVYEALAQTRFTHFGHLVWHLPENSRAEARLAEIEQQCETARRRPDPDVRPDNGEDCEIMLDPERKTTPPADRRRLSRDAAR